MYLMQWMPTLIFVTKLTPSGSLLNSFHPSTRLAPYLGELFGVNQETLAAHTAFVQTDQTDNDFITALTTPIVDGVPDNPTELDILIRELGIWWA